MEEVSFRLVLASLISLALSSPAQAQLTRPAPTRQGLFDAAAPGATLLRSDDGRVRRAWGLAIEAPGETAAARARAFVTRFSGDLAVARRVDLSEARVLEAHGFTLVRFERLAFGGPVLGSSIVVRLIGARVDYVTVSGASAPLGHAREVDLEHAAAQALAALSEAQRVLVARRVGIERGGHVEPGALVDVAGTHLHQRHRVVLDAEGDVLYARPLTLHALGRVYLEDPVSDADTTTDVDLPFLTSRDRLTGRYFRVASCNAGASGCEPTQLALADADGNFLFDPREPAYDDEFAEVHGYHHTNRAAQYFRDEHGFEWSCGADSLMRVIVNYTEDPATPYDNAAYSPSTGGECGFMLFGQGERDFAYDSDVVVHEFSHAVVDLVAALESFLIDRLGLAYDPGSINEGVADYFAATLGDDPFMAEYFMGTSSLSGEGALRRLDNDLVCPDDLVGEVHFDGRIIAATAWELREALGAPKVDALVFSTIAALESGPSLSDFAETMSASATALEMAGTMSADDVLAVNASLEARGLVGCRRIVPLDGGVTRLGHSGNPAVTPALGASLAPVHYRLDIPADTEWLRVEVAPLTATGDYTIHISTDGPVLYSPSRGGIVSDGTIEPGEVITRESMPALPRCGTLYLAIASDDLRAGPSLYEVTAMIQRSGREETCEPEAPDSGLADASTSLDAGPPTTPGGGGCGCAVPAPTTGRDLGALWLLWLPLGLLVGCRRARRERRVSRRARGEARDRLGAVERRKRRSSRQAGTPRR